MPEPASTAPFGCRPRDAIRTWLGAAAVTLAACLAYSNGLHSPLQFDDAFTIAGNPSLRQWTTAFSPPPGTTVAGRPVLNASFALNHLLGGDAITGYHLANLLIHILAGLTLWGIVARTLRAIGRSGLRSDGLGFAVALLWTLHPLQTESVTYLSQRAESLMGFFYLFTLYAFIRGARSANPQRWWIGSVLACFLGMGTKEVMVSAPVIVFLYDRIFVAGSFGRAWRTHRSLYIGLAASWVLLVCLVVSLGGNRSGSTGFGSRVSWWHYYLTQLPALVRYLGLTAWPHPLVFEYGPVAVRWVSGVTEAGLITGAIVSTAVGLIRNSRWAFFGAWFFALLAPTSLVPGAIQAMAEHRMYLASAAIVCAGVVALDSILRPQVGSDGGNAGRIGSIAVACGAAAFAVLTAARNRDYATPLALWSDTVAKRPEHAMAHYNVANELTKIPGNTAAAISEYEAALKLDPRLALVHYNLAVLLESVSGRQPDVIEHYRQAVALDPSYVAAHNNLGTALARAGRSQEAAEQFQAALRLQPGSPAINSNLGTTLYLCGRFEGAAEAYEHALRLRPDDAATERNLALTLEKLGRKTEADLHFARATQLEAGSRSAE